MALTDMQIAKLKSKLRDKHIKMRTNNGLGWSYIEGWHAIAEANRIFGFDGWDRRTLGTSCVWSGAKGETHHAAYTAKVRVTVRAGETVVVREGSGTGEGKALTPGQAHELALKGAETDATKRALATFGNPFGLALYDRDQNGVRKARSGSAASAFKLPAGPLILRSSTGSTVMSEANPSDFIEALKKAMSEAPDIDCLYDMWEQNIETVRAIHRSTNEKPGIVPTLVSHLRACAIGLVKEAANGGAHPPHQQSWHESQALSTTRQKIDKSVLTIGEPKRIRCKEHRRFVASQPCLICGRSPSHAHHVRYAQSRGLSLKVSDEFTVPLCAIHHQQIHTTGKEQAWWQERNIDPLQIAHSLWQTTRAPNPDAPPVDASCLNGDSGMADGPQQSINNSAPVEG